MNLEKNSSGIEDEFKKNSTKIIDLNKTSLKNSEGKSSKQKEPEINIVESFLEETFEFRRNVVNEKIECRKVSSDEDIIEPWKEINENSLARLLAKKGYNFGLAKTSSLLASDFIDSFNPIIDYFNSLKYDPAGPSYIDLLLSKITANNQERFNKHFKKMLVRSIACSTTNEKTNNNFNKQVFVIINREQTIGKSSFIRWLCPPDLREYYIENMSMDKDGQIALSTSFIINLDELAGLSKHDINLLKSKISTASINERLPYGKRRTLYPRRANFFGSTNNDEFLNDDTGNARWLCFQIKEFEYGFWILGNDNYIDINNVWAEAKHLLDSNFKYQLTLEEKIENDKDNRFYEDISIEEELILSFTKPGIDTAAGVNFHASYQIREHLAFNGNLPSDKLSLKKIGSVLKKLKYPYGQKRIGDKNEPRKGFHIELTGSLNLTKGTVATVNESINPSGDKGLPF